MCAGPSNSGLYLATSASALISVRQPDVILVRPTTRKSGSRTLLARSVVQRLRGGIKQLASDPGSEVLPRSEIADLEVAASGIGCRFSTRLVTFGM